MNIKRAKQEIRDTIEAYLSKDEFGAYRIPEIRQRPVLLMGPPGIGKTQIMEQIASECDIGLVSYTITHHTRQSAIGLPFIREKEYGGRTFSVTEYTMSEIIASVYDRMEQSGKKEGILFIDEINCVSETLAPTMLQFLQCKTFGNQKVPAGWIIVAAGNPPEYNKSVRDFDIVTLDRVRVIPVEADFEIWKEYAYAAGIHGAVISYLDIHRDHFYRMETTVDGKRFVTARGWEDLSELICVSELLGKKIDEDVIVQYIQYPKIAKDFSNYLELYYKYQKDYQVDEILAGRIRPGTLEKLRYAPFDERIEIVGLLLSKLSGEFRDCRAADRCTGELYGILKQFRETAGVNPGTESGAGAAAAGGKSVDAAGGKSGDGAGAAAAGGKSGDGAGDTAARGKSADAAGAAARPAEILHALAGEKRDQVRMRIEAGQNERALEAQYRGLFRILERYELLLKEQGGSLSAEKAWDLLRDEFSAEREKLTEQTEWTSEMLEYAFDFMEAAFGESQEMVFFITELSVDVHAMWFISENDCPRYYRYNKAILFEDQGAGVRRQLEEIRSEMRGSGKAAE